VEDVYLMRDEYRQSRGCGFVKYSSKETAMAAIDGLNGTYTMRVSCESHKYLSFSHYHPLDLFCLLASILSPGLQSAIDCSVC
jgi:hypothetical protein